MVIDVCRRLRQPVGLIIWLPLISHEYYAIGGTAGLPRHSCRHTASQANISSGRSVVVAGWLLLPRRQRRLSKVGHIVTLATIVANSRQG